MADGSGAASRPTIGAVSWLASRLRRDVINRLIRDDEGLGPLQGFYPYRLRRTEAHGQPDDWQCHEPSTFGAVAILLSNPSSRVLGSQSGPLGAPTFFDADQTTYGAQETKPKWNPIRSCRYEGTESQIHRSTRHQCCIPLTNRIHVLLVPHRLRHQK